MLAVGLARGCEGTLLYPALYFWRSGPLLAKRRIHLRSGRDLVSGLPVSDRGVPLVTAVNGTLMARRSIAAR